MGSGAMGDDAEWPGWECEETGRAGYGVGWGGGGAARTQSALGTVAYASPEQARGKPTTEASDMFSVGATLFYLAVGQPPYRDIEHISAMELLVRAATGDIDTTGLPAELDPWSCPASTPTRAPAPPRLPAPSSAASPG